MSGPVLSPPAPKFHFNRRVYGAIALALLVATPPVVYLQMSYSSVKGTVVELVSVTRSYHADASDSSLVYRVVVHVWSRGQSLRTHFGSPTFALVVDSFSMEGLLRLPNSGEVGNTGSAYDADGGGSFDPQGYLVYSLGFGTLDRSTAHTLGTAISSRVDFTVNALVAAGWYQQQTTKSDPRIRTW